MNRSEVFRGMLASAVPIITALALVACERKPDAPAVTAPAATSAAGDAYDTSKMDFKPGAAKLSTERLAWTRH